MCRHFFRTFAHCIVILERYRFGVPLLLVWINPARIFWYYLANTWLLLRTVYLFFFYRLKWWRKSFLKSWLPLKLQKLFLAGILHNFLLLKFRFMKIVTHWITEAKFHIVFRGILVIVCQIVSQNKSRLWNENLFEFAIFLTFRNIPVLFFFVWVCAPSFFFEVVALWRRACARIEENKNDFVGVNWLSIYVLQ